MRFFARVYAGGRACSGMLGVMVLVGMLGGCGGTGSYSDYYNPAWMSDGRIIAVRDDVKTSDANFGLGGGGSAEHSYKLVVMNADGSGEHVVKDNANGIFDLNVSPSGNYIAYNGGDKIVILNSDYGTHSTIYWKEESGESLSNFDWSPDETKLIVSTSYARVSVYSRDGVKIRNMDSINYAYAWKYNWLIIGTLEGFRLVNEVNEVVVDDINVSIGGEYFPDGATIFGSVVGAYAKVGIPNFEILETYPTLNSVIESVRGGGVQVNPVDDGEVMYSAGPGSTQSYGREGIYLIRLDGSENRQLRK